MINNKLKSIISTILIVSFIIGTTVSSYASGSGGNDVNVGGGSIVPRSGGDELDTTDSAYLYTGSFITGDHRIGARITLYDIETQNIIKTLDFIDKDYGMDKAKKVRRISIKAKTEIINRMNDDNLDDIIDKIKDDEDVMLVDNHCAPEAIEFPQLSGYFLYNPDAGKSTVEKIKQFYAKDESVIPILTQFPLKEEMIKAFKQRKISILLEPLATSTRINYDENGHGNSETTYAFTCAEVGLLTKNGYYVSEDKFTMEEYQNYPIEKQIFYYSSHSTGSVEFKTRIYLDLPYSTYKEWEGYVKLVPKYDATSEPTYGKFDWMIDRLGCFEITAATISEIDTPCTIKFHPNGKYFGIDSNIDEKYSIKDINVGDEIKIIKTYEDNYFNPTITDEHTYNSYSFKINNKGEAEGSTITIDSNFTISLCHYNYNLRGKRELLITLKH